MPPELGPLCACALCECALCACAALCAHCIRVSHGALRPGAERATLCELICAGAQAPGVSCGAAACAMHVQRASVGCVVPTVGASRAPQRDDAGVSWWRGGGAAARTCRACKTVRGRELASVELISWTWKCRAPLTKRNIIGIIINVHEDEMGGVPLRTSPSHTCLSLHAEKQPPAPRALHSGSSEICFWGLRLLEKRRDYGHFHNVALALWVPLPAEARRAAAPSKAWSTDRPYSNIAGTWWGGRGSSCGHEGSGLTGPLQRTSE